MHYAREPKTEYFVHVKNAAIVSVAENAKKYGWHEPKGWEGVRDILDQQDLSTLSYETDPTMILSLMASLMFDNYYTAVTDALQNGYRIIADVNDTVNWSLLTDQDYGYISHSGRVADIVAYFVNHIDVCGSGE